uniref:Uncharacterized protein n=1 Tax=Arundo donax TaxID=35708 RepID=A0A0A9GBW7_ARUDO
MEGGAPAWSTVACRGPGRLRRRRWRQGMEGGAAVPGDLTDCQR